MSDLYKKDQYLNNDIEYLISREIIEYDIRSAGFNITKKFHLLNENKINHLESLDKVARQIAIGNYQRYDTEYKNNLKEKFIEVRKMFFDANNIDNDDVLSIKKDAIIMLRRCDQLLFDNIEFRSKNIYTSYYHLNKCEFYLKNNELDVKGIADEKLLLHKDYMLDFLFKILKMMEISSSRKQTISNLMEFIYYYKSKQLDIGYYRELNNDSVYKLVRGFSSELLGVDNTNNLDDIDINYNYLKYIVPIINILL